MKNIPIKRQKLNYQKLLLVFNDSVSPSKIDFVKRSQSGTKNALKWDSHIYFVIIIQSSWRIENRPFREKNLKVVKTGSSFSWKAKQFNVWCSELWMYHFNQEILGSRLKANLLSFLEGQFCWMSKPKDQGI